MNTKSSKQRVTMPSAIVTLISIIVACALVFSLTPAYALSEASSSTAHSASSASAAVAAVSGAPADKATDVTTDTETNTTHNETAGTANDDASAGNTLQGTNADAQADGETDANSVPSEVADDTDGDTTAIDAHKEVDADVITIDYLFDTAYAGVAVPFVFAKPSPWEPFIDAQSATAVFDAIPNEQGHGCITIPKTVFSTGAPIDDLSEYQLYLLAYKNNGKLDHQNNPGRFDQNWFKPIKAGGTYEYQYRFAVVDQGDDRFRAELVPYGTHALDRYEVQNLLGDCTHFAVVSDSLEIKGDMEGNIATKNLSGHGEIGITSAVTEAVSEIEIQVYVESEEEEGAPILLTLSNVHTGEVVEHVELVADAWGSAEYVFRISKPAFTSADVYRITTAGEDAEIITPDLGVESGAIMATENINYAKHITCSMLNGKNPISDHIVTTEDTYPGRSLTLETVTEDEFDDIIDIDWMLANVASLSKRLAHAASGNGYAVYHLNADDLTGGQRLNIRYDEQDSAIINVVVPSALPEFTISPDTLMLGSHNLCDGQTWDSFASKVLWNFVDENGEPYQGIVATTRTMKGTFLVPCGTYHPDSSSPALIVAKQVIQGNGEFHKVPFGCSGVAAYSMSVFPEGGGDIDIDDEWPPLSPFPPGWGDDGDDDNDDGDEGDDGDPTDPVDPPDTTDPTDPVDPPDPIDPPDETDPIIPPGDGDDDQDPDLAEPTIDIEMLVPDEHDYGLYIDQTFSFGSAPSWGIVTFENVPVAESFEYFVKNENTGAESETFRIKEVGEDTFSFEYADEDPEHFRETLVMTFSPRAPLPGTDGDPDDPQQPSDPDDPQGPGDLNDPQQPSDPDPDEGSGKPSVGPDAVVAEPTTETKTALRTLASTGMATDGAAGRQLSQTNDDIRMLIVVCIVVLCAAAVASVAGIRRLRRDGRDVAAQEISS